MKAEGALTINGGTVLVTEGVEEVIKREKVDKCFAIGPAIMMKFVCLLTKKYEIPTDVSLNTIMVDGTGMCGACRITVGGKTKFVCVDGPEFDGHQVDFDEMLKRMGAFKKITSSELSRISFSRMIRSLLRPANTVITLFPAAFKACTIGSIGATPTPPPAQTTVPKFSI